MNLKTLKIGIVGTRGNDTNKLSESLFSETAALARRIINSIIDAHLQVTKVSHLSFTLVSGGSSFVDAIAPYLWRRGGARWLTLHLPCKWDNSKSKFSEENKYGKILNYNHSLTSDIFFQNSNATLEDIQYAMDSDVSITVSSGFLNRNSLIAKGSDYLICCTFGNGNKLSRGGTMDTFRKFIMIKDHKKTFHVDLNTMNAYSPASL